MGGCPTSVMATAFFFVFFRIKQPSRLKKKKKPECFGTQITYQNIKLSVVRKKFKPGPLLVFAVSKGREG